MTTPQVILRNLYSVRMSIQEIIRLQRLHPEDKIYLLVQGSFYHAYNEGAELLHNIMGYKVRKVTMTAPYDPYAPPLSPSHTANREPSSVSETTYTLLGFPISSLSSVLGRLSSYYKDSFVLVESLEYPHLILEVKKK